MKFVNHIFVAGLFFAPMAQADVQHMIVGGVEASIGEFPFIVSLQSSSHFCGGSLIKKDWVLTAAHCVRGGTIRKVVIGMHDQKNQVNAEVMTVKRVIAHPNYNPSSMDYDVALVQLNGESRYEPIRVNNAEINIPTDASSQIPVVTAGWGATREGDYRLPDKLQKVEVPLVPSATCNQGYPGKITDRMICAGLERGGKDSCQGDSGGPLVATESNGERTLVGVVSWGRGCARPNHLYGVYAKVNAVADWIAQNAE